MFQNCNYCQTKKTISYKVNFPSFRHLDFKKISEKSFFLKCKLCGLISSIQKNQSKKNKQMFKSLNYLNSKQTNQKKFYNNDFYLRSQIQSFILLKDIKNESNILDIGCFDGKLLFYLSKKLDKSNFYGLEINLKLKKNFPKKKNFYFHTKFEDIKKIKFDIIILSHSIMYFNNINKLFKLFNKLLCNSGKIFIQIPDIEQNPINILLGDQKNIFNINSMKRISMMSGLQVVNIEKKKFKREILFTIKKNPRKMNLTKSFKNNLLEKSLLKIKKFKRNVNRKFLREKYSIFGTTVNSAFLHELLKKKIKYFIDENKTKNSFRNLKVVKPKKGKINLDVIIPFDEKKIFLQKLKKKYNSNFIYV